MKTEEQIQLLINLGLTSSSSKICLSLANSGPTTAQEISKNTQIAIQDVYRLLKKLTEIGIVIKNINIPTIYEAIPIEHIVEHLVKDYELRQRELKKELKVFVKQVNSRKKIFNKPVDQQLLSLTVGPELIRKLGKDYAESKESFQVLSFSRIAQAASFYDDPKTNARIISGPKKSSTVIGISIKDLNSRIFENAVIRRFYLENPAGETRFTTEPLKANLWVGDNKKAIIVLQEEGKFLDIPVLTTNNPALVFLAYEYFLKMWEKAMSLDELRKIHNVSV